jgi:hypothetical protein
MKEHETTPIVTYIELHLCTIFSRDGGRFENLGRQVVMQRAGTAAVVF